MELVIVTKYEIYADTDKALGLWDGHSYCGWANTEKRLIWCARFKKDGTPLCTKIGRNQVIMPKWFAEKKGLSYEV